MTENHGVSMHYEMSLHTLVKNLKLYITQIKNLQLTLS